MEGVVCVKVLNVDEMVKTVNEIVRVPTVHHMPFEFVSDVFTENR